MRCTAGARLRQACTGVSRSEGGLSQQRACRGGVGRVHVHTTPAGAAAGSAAVTLDKVLELVGGSTDLLVLTGAGVSTDSGIPDYRSPGRPPHKPITHSEFMGSHSRRQQYWARSYFGFTFMTSKHPNASHFALAAAEKAGRVQNLITQNVDGLHQDAGSGNVCELHGGLHNVVCMSDGCGYHVDRTVLQAQLEEANAELLAEAWGTTAGSSSGSGGGETGVPAAVRPDGDMLLAHLDQRAFAPVPCPTCSGVLKPDVVFFGDNLRHGLREETYAMVDQADTVLVAGTTLTTWSSYRLAKRAAESGKPVVILNRGPTRMEKNDVPSFKFDGGVADALTALFPQ